MKLHLLAVGRRMPEWVNTAFADYSRRMPAECSLHLNEIEPYRRGKAQSRERAREEEGQRLLRAIPGDALVIALDERGKSLSSVALAGHLDDWLQAGRDVALLVGGADGLSTDCLQRANWRWSLSELTLPHAMVRVLLAEQLYRAWSISRNHPYHRE